MDQLTQTPQNGLIFSEVLPNTYLAHFTDYEKEPAINTAQAQYYLDQVKKFANEHPSEKINIINDTRLISDRVRSLSSDARKLYGEAYAHPQIGKVAMVGFGPWLKNFILILARFAGRSSQTAFFDDTEKALEWIKKESPL